MTLPDDVALYIASAIKSNVRELEGALIRLAAYASLSKRRIDLEFAQETLGAAITRPREIITVETIIKSVASYYGLKTADIKSDRRHKSLANPRAVAMYLSRHHTKDSYPGPRARVRRQAPHDRHLGRPKDRRAAQGGRLAALRDPRDRIDDPEVICPVPIPVDQPVERTWTNSSSELSTPLVHGIHRHRRRQTVCA